MASIYDYIVSFWTGESTTNGDDIYREQEAAATTHSEGSKDEWTMVETIRDDTTDDIIMVQSSRIIDESKIIQKRQRRVLRKLYKRLPRTIQEPTGKLLTLRDRQAASTCSPEQNELKMVLYSRGLAKVPELKMDADILDLILQSKPVLKYFSELEIQPNQDNVGYDFDALLKRLLDEYRNQIIKDDQPRKVIGLIEWKKSDSLQKVSITSNQAATQTYQNERVPSRMPVEELDSVIESMKDDVRERSPSWIPIQQLDSVITEDQPGKVIGLIEWKKSDSSQGGSGSITCSQTLVEKSQKERSPSWLPVQQLNSVIKDDQSRNVIGLIEWKKSDSSLGDQNTSSQATTQTSLTERMPSWMPVELDSLIDSMIESIKDDVKERLPSWIPAHQPKELTTGSHNSRPEYTCGPGKTAKNDDIDFGLEWDTYELNQKARNNDNVGFGVEWDIHEQDKKVTNDYDFDFDLEWDNFEHSIKAANGDNVSFAHEWDTYEEVKEVDSNSTVDFNQEWDYQESLLTALREFNRMIAEQDFCVAAASKDEETSDGVKTVTKKKPLSRYEKSISRSAVSKKRKRSGAVKKFASRTRKMQMRCHPYQPSKNL